MATNVITNVDRGSVLLKSSEIGFQSDQVTVPATTTYAEGTILARDSVSGLLVAFVAGGSTNENGIPKTLLTYAVENTTGSPVNTAVRVPVTAKVRRQRLRIHPATTDAGVTKPVEDGLRSYGIHPVDVDDLSILDNQP